MGRIADATEIDVDERVVWTNLIDVILDGLDDDDDRQVVLGWLRSETVSAIDIVFRLDSYGIRCSDKSIQKWRRAQKFGRGRVWDA